MLLALAAVCHAGDPVPPPETPGAERAAQITDLWQDDRKQANRELKKWMKSDEHSPWPWIAAADLRFREERYGKCVSMADAALKRSPNMADAFYWRGRCLESRGKTLEAANEYGAALEAQPAHAAASEGLARLKPQLGETTADAQSN